MNASHPELEDLAGLLDEPDDGPAERGLAAHVAGCPRCQADLRALRTVQQTLRALPAIPMPESVAARLESAVRASTSGPYGESDAESDAEPDGEPYSEPERTLPAAASSRRRPRTAWQLPHMSAAAGIAVLLIIALGTGIAVMATRGGSSNGKTSSASGGSAATGASTIVTASGADYRQATIRSQVAALVVERVPGSTAKFSGLQPLAGDVAAGKAAVPSRTQESSAAAAAGGFAAASPQAPQALTADSAIAPARNAPGGPLANPAALQACVRALNGGTPIQPVLVDYARFDGRPATVIVLPSPQSPTKLAVWVELDGSDCATKGETAYYGSLSATP